MVLSYEDSITQAGNTDAGDIKERGSVAGVLYAYSRGKTIRARMRNEHDNRAVMLDIPGQLNEDAKNLLDRRVLVYGDLCCDRVTGAVKRVEVAQLMAFPRKKPTGDYARFQGILGTDWMGGLSAVEIVSRDRV